MSTHPSEPCLGAAAEIFQNGAIPMVEQSPYCSYAFVNCIPTDYILAPGVMFHLFTFTVYFCLQQRYYGKSLPFGSASFTGDNIGYLSVEQALADYAVLLTQLKQDYMVDKVVAFGGR